MTYITSVAMVAVEHLRLLLPEPPQDRRRAGRGAGGEARGGAFIASVRRALDERLPASGGAVCGSAPRGEEERGADSLLNDHDSRRPATAAYMADCLMEGKTHGALLQPHTWQTVLWKVRHTAPCYSHIHGRLSYGR